MLNVTTDLWIRQFHPAPEARARLLCLPHAGGSASYFFSTSRALAPEVEVLAVQYPGRQDRRAEPFVRTIDELADVVAGVLNESPDTRPLAIFGHSMGAIIGYEVALRLERAGTTPATLFVSGRRAPSTHRDEQVHRRDDDGVLAEIRALSGTDAKIMADDDLVRMMLPALRNDYQAIETYRYRPSERVSCPIHAMVGDNDPKATVDEVRAWADHTSGETHVRVFPGGHFYLDQHASTVLKEITATLLG